MVEMRKIADCSGQALRRLKEGWTAQPPADGGDPVDEVDKVGNWSHYALMADTITVDHAGKGGPDVQAEDAQSSEMIKNLRAALRQGGKGIRPAGLVRLLEKAFVMEFPPDKSDDNRLANALVRGVEVREKLRNAEGGSLSAENAAELLGISKAAILKRYQKGQIVAWREEKQDAVRFPRWQFDDRRVLNGLEKALDILRGKPLDDYGRMLFFLSNVGFLGGRRPLDCMRQGDIDSALQAAEMYGG